VETGKRLGREGARLFPGRDVLQIKNVQIRLQSVLVPSVDRPNSFLY